MNEEESIDARNNVREFRHYTESLTTVPEEDIQAEKERMQKLYEKHSKQQVSLWKDID